MIFLVKYFFFMETLKTRHRFIRVPVVGRRLWYCGAVVVVRSEIVCPVVRREERGERKGASSQSGHTAQSLRSSQDRT